MANDTDIEDVAAEDSGGDTGFESQEESQASPSQPLAGPMGPMTGSPVSTMTQRPMEVPDPMASAMQAGMAQQQTMPWGQQVQQRHGGLLTGLAGVLLDGLAGAMAPSRAAAFEAPMRLQQMAMQKEQMQLQQEKMQQEMQLEPIRMRMQLAQAQILELNLHRETEELGMEDLMGKSAKAFAEKSIEAGTADQIGTADNYEDAMKGVQNLSAQNEDHQLKLFAYPLTGDVSGKWGIYKAYPDKSLPEDMDIPVPVSDEHPDGNLHLKAGTPMGMVTLQVNTARQLGVEDVKAQAALKKQWYSGIDATSGLKKVVRGDELKSSNLVGATPANQQQMNKWSNDLASVQQGQVSLNRYQSDYEKLNTNLNPTQAEAVRTLTQPDETMAGSLVGVSIAEAEDFVNGLRPGSGIGVKVMKSKVEQEQWERAGPEGQQLVADYYHAVISNLAYQRARMGSAPRQREIVLAEMRALPRPGMPQSAGQAAFADTQQDMRAFRSAIPANIAGLPPETFTPTEQGQPQAPPQSLQTPPQSQPPAPQAQPGPGPAQPQAAPAPAPAAPAPQAAPAPAPAAAPAAAAPAAPAPAATPTAATPESANIWQSFKGDTGLNKLADHVIAMEGDSRQARENNNPGNLKDPATGKFMKFSSYQEGRDALLRQLKHWRDQHPDWSVSDFNRVYAPNKSHGGDNPDGTEEGRNRHLMSVIGAM